MTPGRKQSLVGLMDLLAIVLICMAASAVQLWINQGWLGSGNFPDPDDALRLVQIRDWLAGQSWFDVTQYRIAPPAGVAMHWSRLADLPVAGLITLFDTLTGREQAEAVAVAVAPLLLHLMFLTGVFLLAVYVTQQRQIALLACALSALTPGIAVQFRPLRIDHHGLQISLMVLAAALLFHPWKRARAAAVSGLLAAMALVVSIENLPMTMAMAGVLALRYLRSPEHLRELAGFMAGLSAGCLLLLMMTGKLQWIGAAQCDAMSASHLVPIAVFGSCISAASWGRTLHSPARRILLLTAATATAAAAALLAGRECIGDPFSGLPPLLRELWYDKVKEGLPLWRQPLPNVALSVVPSLFGLCCALAALLRDDASRRQGWIELLLLQSAAFAVSVVVFRALSMAHALAIPGNAWLLLTAVNWALRRGTRTGRLTAAMICLLIIPQVLVTLTTLAATQLTNGGRKLTNRMSPCFESRIVGELDLIPPALLFAPVDVGPAILLNSRHSVVASGHHRNESGLLAVISGFTAPPGEAEAIIRKTGARYLVYCPDQPELNGYAKHSPSSLAALLLSGRMPAWLRPAGSGAKGYRVLELVDDKAVTE